MSERGMQAVNPGLYWWVRHVDETGMAGTGRVAQVAVFDDGSAVLRWLKDKNAAGVQSTVLYDSIKDLVWIHGHGERKTGSLLPAIAIGEIAQIDMIDGCWCVGTVVGIRDEATSHYQIQPVRKHHYSHPEPFWAHDFEVRK